MKIAEKTQITEALFDDDEVDHYHCCRLEQDFVGFTITRCGQAAFVNEFDDEDDDDFVDDYDCLPCAEAFHVTHTCPLFGICRESE